MVKYVMVADTNRKVCEILSELISQRKSIDMVLCCMSYKDIIHFLNLNSFDMIFIRIDEIELNGLEIARKIQENFPQCRVILTAEMEYFETVNFDEKSDGLLRLPKNMNIIKPIKKQLEAIFKG